MRRLRALAAAVAAVTLAGCSAQSGAGQAALPQGCILDVPSLIGGPIDLVDQNGAPVTQATFAGRPTLLFFGFTYCPEICPAKLQIADAALKRLGPAADQVQTALVTIDPGRDTPAQMKAYVESDVFPDGLYGLTGSEQQTQAAAKAFRVMTQRVESPGVSDYTFNHSTFFYLLDGNWRPSAMINAGDMSPADVAECLSAGLGLEPGADGRV